MKFVFVVVGGGVYVHEYLHDCLGSIAEQQYLKVLPEKWETRIRIDSDNPNVLQIINAFKLQAHITNVGMNLSFIGGMANLIDVLRSPGIADEDVILCVDADDRLMNTTGITAVYKAYNTDAELMLTYGSFCLMSSGYSAPSSMCRAYGEQENPLTAPWHMSHLKTFRVMAFRAVPPELWLDQNGKPFTVTQDMATMLPMYLLYGPKRARFIPEVSYEYNDITPDNDSKNRRAEQIAAERFIRTRDYSVLGKVGATCTR